MLSPAQAKILIERIQNAEIAQFFEEIKEAGVQDAYLGKLEKEFISGRIQPNFEDRLITFVSSIESNPVIVKNDRDILLKVVVSFIISTIIGFSLAIMASKILDTVLENNGLSGAINGIFEGGVFFATVVSITGGIGFGYIFGLHKKIIERISIGIISGIIIGAIFANSFKDSINTCALGIVFFITYGSMWGGIGGMLFATIIYPIFKKMKLRKSDFILSTTSSKILTKIGIITSILIITLFIFYKPQPKSNDVYIVVATFSECGEAYEYYARLKGEKEFRYYDMKIIILANSKLKFAVSLGKYRYITAKKEICNINGIIRKDVYLTNLDNIMKEMEGCE